MFPDFQPYLMGRMVVQIENVTVLEDNHIRFDFLGKDSIRYENEVAVHPKVHKLVHQFCKCKDSKGNSAFPLAAPFSQYL